MKVLLALFFVMSAGFCFAQVSQSFNSGGQAVKTQSIEAEYNIGTSFVSSYSSGQVQEGVFFIHIEVTGLEDEANGIKVFPIPFSHEFTIQTDGTPHQFMIYSTTGQVVKEGNVSGKESNVKLDASPGIFILKIYSPSKDSWYGYKIEKLN